MIGDSTSKHLFAARRNYSKRPFGDQFVVDYPENSAGDGANNGTAGKVSDAGADRGINTAQQPNVGMDGKKKVFEKTPGGREKI